MDRRTFLATTAAALSIPLITRKKKEFFSTGIPTLDKHFDGGFRPGHLYLVCGNSRNHLYSSILNANKDVTFTEEDHNEGSSLELSLNCEGPSFSKLWTKDQFTDYEITSAIRKSLWDKPQCKVLFTPPCTEGDFLFYSYGFLRPVFYGYGFLRPVDGMVFIKNKKISIIKNRYGKNGIKIPFKLVTNGFTTIMKEVENG